MTRVKRSVNAKKKRRKTLELTKGFRGEANSNYKRAKEALTKADSYAYRDRRNRKRDFRRLWITRINAAARLNGMSYGAVHPRPEAGRDRAGPQGPGRHRRARSRDVPPICRGRPRGVGSRCVATPADTKPHRAPLPPERRPFFARHRTVITSHHNPLLKDIRRLQARGASAAASWPRARTCSRRPRPRAGTPRARCCAAGRRRRAEDALAKVSALGSGTRALAVYEERWATRAGRPAVRRAVGRQGPGQRRHRPARRARLRRGVRRARPRHRRPVRAQGGARVDGRDLRRAGRARRARSTSCPGERVALVARARRAAARAGARPRRTLVVGAERAGLPEDVVAACDRAAHIPIANESLNAAMAATLALYELT